jgi:hypothetical protein
MDNDSGRGSRSGKPPPLATVRRLRLNEYTSRSGAEDDWYETERLTGQITGRAPSAAATDEPALRPKPTLALDWRNPDPGARPSAAQRLRRGLDRRRRAKVTLRFPRPHNSLRRHRRSIAAEVPEGKAAESTTSGAPETVGDRNDATRPLLGFRRGPEPELPKAARASSAKARERVSHPARGRGASIVAATLVAAATATIGIAAALSSSPAKPRRAEAAAASSGHAPHIEAAARVLGAAVGFMERQIAARSNAYRAVRARRGHPAAHRSHAHQHPSKSQSAAPPPSPSPTSTASSSGSSGSTPAYSGSSSTRAYSGSSATPSTSSQSGTSESAATGTAQRTSSTQQPAFGQNGTLGPGRGASGTQ